MNQNTENLNDLRSSALEGVKTAMSNDSLRFVMDDADGRCFVFLDMKKGLDVANQLTDYLNNFANTAPFNSKRMNAHPVARMYYGSVGRQVLSVVNISAIGLLPSYDLCRIFGEAKRDNCVALLKKRWPEGEASNLITSLKLAEFVERKLDEGINVKPSKPKSSKSESSELKPDKTPLTVENPKVDPIKIKSTWAKRFDEKIFKKELNIFAVNNFLLRAGFPEMDEYGDFKIAAPDMHEAIDVAFSRMCPNESVCSEKRVYSQIVLETIQRDMEAGIQAVIDNSGKLHYVEDVNVEAQRKKNQGFSPQVPSL